MEYSGYVNPVNEMAVMFTMAHTASVIRSVPVNPINMTGIAQQARIRLARPADKVSRLPFAAQPLNPLTPKTHKREAPGYGDQLAHEGAKNFPGSRCQPRACGSIPKLAPDRECRCS